MIDDECVSTRSNTLSTPFVCVIEVACDHENAYTAFNTTPFLSIYQCQVPDFTVVCSLCLSGVGGASNPFSVSWCWSVKSSSLELEFMRTSRLSSDHNTW